MEQLERSQRYLKRIKNIYSGVFSPIGHDKDSYDDDVISFFIHCYHVRDWVIHLNKVGVSAKQVDEFINNHIPLKICADLANGSKHCKLTRNLRTERQPHFITKEHKTSLMFTSNGGGELLLSKYQILSDGVIYDALELAEESVLLWGTFISKLYEEGSVKW